MLADLDGRIDLIIDSGPTELGLESTVLDLTTPAARLLRPGPISAKELEAALGECVVEHLSSTSRDRLSSPGQMPVHYAPSTRSFRIASMVELGEMGNCENMAFVVIGEHATPSLSGFAAHYVVSTPEEASRQLYDILHRCDSLGVSAIIVLMPPDNPAWRAVRDRLLRAHGHSSESSERDVHRGAQVGVTNTHCLNLPHRRRGYEQPISNGDIVAICNESASGPPTITQLGSRTAALSDCFSNGFVGQPRPTVTCRRVSAALQILRGRAREAAQGAPDGDRRPL